MKKSGMSKYAQEKLASRDIQYHYVDAFTEYNMQAYDYIKDDEDFKQLSKRYPDIDLKVICLELVRRYSDRFRS